MKKQKKEMPYGPLFSGGNSEDMWQAINEAYTKKQLRLALWQVCCQLQKLEYRMSVIADRVGGWGE